MSETSSAFALSSDVELLEAGRYSGRRSGRSPVALSRCTFQVDSIEKVRPCIDALIQFERHLRKRSDEDTLYEWASIIRRGLAFELYIHWYSLEFFLDRRDAYMTGPHPFAFERFGCRPSDFEVSHFSLHDDRAQDSI